MSGGRSSGLRFPVAAPASQRGVSLIEVLIAVLVLSIGLLGLAGLQATALQANQGAHLRSQAVNLAYDMSDRMRANRARALSGAYDDVAPEQADCEPGVTLAGNYSAAGDISEWRNAIACLLPGGRGQISRNGEIFTISVRWEDRFEQGDDAPDRSVVTIRVRL